MNIAAPGEHVATQFAGKARMKLILQLVKGSQLFHKNWLILNLDGGLSVSSKILIIFYSFSTFK